LILFPDLHLEENTGDGLYCAILRFANSTQATLLKSFIKASYNVKN